jgi:DNA-binding SARP family transcriptional activator/tetratricopeptide (TPR) repeat protein
MVTAMQFGLLGPLVVRRGETVVPVQAGKQRAVLAALLLNANRIVPVDVLAETLWGTAAPPSARVTVQNNVARLRKALGDEGRSLITTHPRGYVIRVAEGDLDVAEFEALLGAARQAAKDGSWDTAADKARTALALWRGGPLVDVESELLAVREVPRLADLRVQAVEIRIEADLYLGRHAEVTGELRQLTAAYPLREHLHGLLMLALYREGRQAEALAAFQTARRILNEELGTQPGPELRSLHQQILSADPALDLAGPPRPAAPSGRVVPRELPAGVRHFTGREAELATLTGLLDEPSSGQGIVVISAIGGTAGVGKTALAVQWAHQVAGRFPDGQLYVNLRGYDHDEPVSAGDALAALLRTLGVPGTNIPDQAEERARQYRSELAGRRVLVVLDNARDGEQVRPLLPGDSGCAALVTSRDALAGLVAADGARRLDLDVLPPADAVALLRSLIGPRAAADPAAAAELAGLCARLPLALRIAAELAAGRPADPLAGLVAELKAGRLDSLDAGDERADVRAVFSWSVRQLPDDAARAFALIGLHPGEDLEVYAAAAVTGASPLRARKMLDQLQRASLIHESGPGRYGMHDLLRAYARELTAAEQDGSRDVGGRAQQAMTRLFDFYLAAAGAAMEVLYPAETHLRPSTDPAAVAVPELAGEAQARAWLDRERANLVAMVAHCAECGWPEHAIGLADTLHRYLIYGSHLPEASTIYRHALHAARRSADPAAEAVSLLGLGSIALYRGQFRDAAAEYRLALERYRQCGDRTGQARVLGNLGITEQQLHNHQSAAGYYRQAIAASEDAGDNLNAARALTHLAYVETEMGAHDQAEEHLRQALPVFRKANDQDYEAVTLEAIGELHRLRGRLTQAAEFFQQALTINRRAGNPTGVADQLANLGNVSLRRGEYQQAIDYLRQALALHQQVGYQHGEVQTRRSLAEALHAAGQPAAARAELTAALQLAAETGSTYQQASAHRDLAESHQRSGEDERARYHWQEALTLYTELGVPEAEQVQSQLIRQAAEVP